SDLKKYVSHVTSVAIEKTKTSPVDSRGQLLRHTGEIIVNQLFVESLDPELYDNARKFVESAVSSLTKETNALELLQLLNNPADFVSSHSVAVRFFGPLLARQAQWTSPPNLFKVAMGGLLHDVGLKEVDAAILRKPRAELTADEARQLDSHTLRGRDILG